MLKPALYIFILLGFVVICANSFAFNYESLLSQETEKILKEADQYYEENVLDTALIYYMALTRKYEPHAPNNYNELIIKAYIRIGDINYRQYNYNKALDFYLEGVRISEKENILQFLPELYKNLGNVYSMYLDYEEVKTFYQKGLELAQMQNNIEMQWKILSNLIGAYCNDTASQEDLERAKEYYKQFVDLPYHDNHLKKYYEFFNLGYIYNCANLPDSAIICFKKALDNIHQIAPQSLYGYYPASLLGMLFSEKKEFDKSLKYYFYCNQISRQTNSVDLTLKSLSNIASTYKEMGNSQKSYSYRIQYLDLQDSLYAVREIDLKSFHKSRNYQTLYEIEKANWQIDILNIEKEKRELVVRTQRNMIMIISFSLLLLLIFFIIVYIQKNKLKRAYINLFERNNEIIKSDKENRKLRNEYEKRLEEKNIQLQSLIKETKFIPEILSFSSELSENSNDKTLLLTEEHKLELISHINQIMENTTEFCDCDFNLLRLAELVDSNTKYVSYIINEVHNKNFRTYINEYRIKEASIRLLDTEKFGNYTIKAIAESVGFKSPTTFITMFKKITGINPSTYQKIAKNEL